MDVIITIFDTEMKFRFVKQEYLNGNMAIHILYFDEEDEAWEPWCYLTTNFNEMHLTETTAVLDTNNCNDEIITWLRDQNYIRKIGMKASGYCTYPIVKFSASFLENILITDGMVSATE